jgi:hypothetical protein
MLVLGWASLPHRQNANKSARQVAAEVAAAEGAVVVLIALLTRAVLGRLRI